ncbi:MAG TPA: hypothetical protein VFK70_04200 [Vicinamibacteria bacterium]|nr:hypothetical protein [Vicinamibacteria bacterium]
MLMRSIGTLTALLIPAAAALAAGPASVPDRPWTLRGDFTINTPSEPLPGDAVLAVSLARRFGRHWAVEGTIGPGLPTSMAARDASGVQRSVDIDSGLHAALLLRADHKLTASGRSALSLAAGPSLVSGDAYGTVPMLRTELAFDLRFARRWVFFYGLGYEWALKDSRSPIPASDCIVTGCPPQYRSGKGQVTSRVGLGLTF